MRTYLIGVPLAVILLVQSAAVGHEKNGYDGNDTGGPFDIITTHFVDQPGDVRDRCQRGNCFYFYMRMQRKWRRPMLDLASVSIDVRGDKRPDYEIAIRFKRGVLRGNLINLHNRRLRPVREVWRYNRYLGVVIKKKQVSPIQQVLRWSSYTSFKSKRICTQWCFDSTSTFAHRF